MDFRFSHANGRQLITSLQPNLSQEHYLYAIRNYIFMTGIIRVRNAKATIT